jgi:hypothetical protein
MRPGPCQKVAKTARSERAWCMNDAALWCAVAISQGVAPLISSETAGLGVPLSARPSSCYGTGFDSPSP